MTIHRARYLRNRPLPIHETIGWTPDIGSEVIFRVQFRVADKPRADLLGWVRIELRCRIVLDWVAIRRRPIGGLALSFPGRRSGAFGYRWYCVPLHEVEHEWFDDEVFRHLGLDRETS